MFKIVVVVNWLVNNLVGSRNLWLNLQNKIRIFKQFCKKIVSNYQIVASYCALFNGCCDTNIIEILKNYKLKNVVEICCQPGSML